MGLARVQTIWPERNAQQKGLIDWIGCHSIRQL